MRSFKGTNGAPTVALERPMSKRPWGTTAHPGHASVASVLVTTLRFALYRNDPHFEEAKRKRDDDDQHQAGNQRFKKP